MKSLSLSLVLLSGVIATAHAASIPADQLAFFEQKIRPLLVKECYECHSAQAKKVKGGLLLDTKAGWTQGGDSGKAVIQPGSPDSSLFIKVVRHEIEDKEMPPKKKLTDAQIADLTAWVKMGAPDPREGVIEAKRADKSWWSLQPLAKTEPPATAALKDAVKKVPKAGRTQFDFKEWQANPIDRYVLARLAEKELQPNPPADRHTLIRRVTYDLTGLPPTPEEVQAFIADKRPDAYERLVDCLLASPQYGEQWGRHWLDVVRFGESRGFERNQIIDDAWPFRDYVIRSFNADKPFNQFIVEHLAGDVVGKNNPDVEVGTVFLVAGPYDDVGNQDKVAQAQIRANTLDDIITATGSAFLGLTVNCARCHNHKFDPVPQADYYRLQSTFAGVRHGSRTLVSLEERQKHDAATKDLTARKSTLTKERADLEKSIIERARAGEPGRRVYPRPAPSPQLTEESFAPVKAKFVRLRILASSATPRTGSGARLDEFEVWTAGASPRNVALASNGGKATGATQRQAGDFAKAYDVSLVNDGKFGARWFVGYPAELDIELARVEEINRVVFSNDRIVPRNENSKGQGAYVTEYQLWTSLDMKTWVKAADSTDRLPATKATADERLFQAAVTKEERQQLADYDKQLGEVDRALRAIPPLPEVWAGNYSQPKEETHISKGGDPMKPGDLVQPASLDVLKDVTSGYELPADAPESQRRLALAKWITSDDNPLTARVLVNRLWHYHFGTGIVDTPSDFGFLGGQPTHPGLIDWLANQLHANHWQIKALHREIVLSQTYRQSGDYRETAAKADKDSRFLWRFPPRRLSAEEIRDTTLALAGKLDGKMGGHGFRLYRYSQDNVATYFPLDKVGPDTYRRAVYHQNARASVVDMLSDFDLPDNTFSAPRRANTTTPLQTLTMMNHAFALDMASALSERVQKESSQGDFEAQVNRLYELAFQREPSRHERKAAVQLVQSYGLHALCRAILNANELIYLE